ncbi:hypothetical protein C8R42DRAFT_371835 [Lentinula raphanica]|nr:hypothetical protein C8R42DRAFT_371835 [Lentinula raphanica]
MRFRVLCSLSAAVLFCVVSVTPRPVRSGSRTKKENIDSQKGKIRAGLRTGFGKDDEWLLPTAPWEDRKQANPLVCLAGYFCIGRDKHGGVYTVDIRKHGNNKPFEEYYVELPVTTKGAFRRKWKGYRETMPHSQLNEAGLTPNTFIPRILTSIRQDITVEDRANLPKIIGFVYALKAPDVATAIASLPSDDMDAVTLGPNADSTSSEFITTSSTGVVTDRVRLWAGLFVGKEPVWLGAPLEERKEADPAICFGGFFCLYYGKDGHVHNVDMYKAGEGKRPAAGFYKELPIVLSTMFRRKYVQHAALQTMMNVETLLTKTNTPKDALNPKSYIHVAVKSNCKNLLPHLLETEFEKHVVPRSFALWICSNRKIRARVLPLSRTNLLRKMRKIWMRFRRRIPTLLCRDLSFMFRTYFYLPFFLTFVWCR